MSELKNVSYTLDASTGKLTITIDTSIKSWRSSNDKADMLASTGYGTPVRIGEYDYSLSLGLFLTDNSKAKQGKKATEKPVASANAELELLRQQVALLTSQLSGSAQPVETQEEKDAREQAELVAKLEALQKQFKPASKAPTSGKPANAK